MIRASLEMRDVFLAAVYISFFLSFVVVAPKHIRIFFFGEWAVRENHFLCDVLYFYGGFVSRIFHPYLDTNGKFCSILFSKIYTEQLCLVHFPPGESHLQFYQTIKEMRMSLMGRKIYQSPLEIAIDCISHDRVTQFRTLYFSPKDPFSRYRLGKYWEHAKILPNESNK